MHFWDQNVWANKKKSLVSHLHPYLLQGFRKKDPCSISLVGKRKFSAFIHCLKLLSRPIRSVSFLNSNIFIAEKSCLRCCDMWWLRLVLWGGVTCETYSVRWSLYVQIETYSVRQCDMWDLFCEVVIVCSDWDLFCEVVWHVRLVLWGGVTCETCSVRWLLNVQIETCSVRWCDMWDLFCEVVIVCSDWDLFCEVVIVCSDWDLFCQVVWHVRLVLWGGHCMFRLRLVLWGGHCMFRLRLVLWGGVTCETCSVRWSYVQIETCSVRWSLYVQIETCSMRWCDMWDLFCEVVIVCSDWDLFCEAVWYVRLVLWGGRCMFMLFVILADWFTVSQHLVAPAMPALCDNSHQCCIVCMLYDWQQQFTDWLAICCLSSSLVFLPL